MMKNIKKNIKIGFRVLLSLSLILNSCYGYSTPSGPSDSFDLIEKVINRPVKDSEKETPEVQEAVRIFNDMGEAVKKGDLKPFFENYPELKNMFRVLSLENQEVEILDYAEKLDFVIDFNKKSDYQNYNIPIQKIEVDFDQNKNLIFKGVIIKGDEEEKEEEKEKEKRKKQIGLIHRFKTINKADIIDSAYDGEILAVLHREKGLILYHTMMAKAKFLGSTPIPSISIPVSFLEKWENLKTEFFNRAVQPPINPDHPSVTLDLHDRPMFQAGDLLISSRDFENKKNIVQIFSRETDLKNALVKMYTNLELLLQIRHFLTNASNTEDFEGNLFVMKNDLNRVLHTLFTSFSNENSLSFFDKFENLIKPIKYYLIYQHTHENKDKFHYDEWLEDYEKLKTFTIEENNISSKEIGEHLMEAGKAVKNIEEEKENKLDKSLRKWQEFWEKSAKRLEKNPYVGKHIGKILEEEKANASVVLVAFLFVILNINTIPVVGSSNYGRDTINSLIWLGAGSLALIFFFAQVSIPFLKLIEKTWPQSNFKITLNQWIEKWKDRNNSDRVTGLGFKIAAGFLPVFERGFQIFGQRHLYEALTKGAHPSLGFGGFHWKEDLNKSRLIDAAVEQKRKINSLSRIMTYYAILDKPFDVLSLVVWPLDLEEELKILSENQKFKRNFFWMSDKLSKHIEKSNKIDKTLPILEWDINMLTEDYYKKALSLAKEVQNISFSKIQISRLETSFKKWMRRVLQWNTKHADMLMKYHPSKVISDQFFYGLILDHFTMMTLPLTAVTPRGDFYGPNMDRIGIDPVNRLNTSGPHLHEVALNAFIHIILSARTQLVKDVESKGMEVITNTSKDYQDLYRPIEEDLNKTENKSRTRSYLKNWLKFPLSSFGDKIHKGTDFEERVDVGRFLWRMQMMSYRLLALTLSVGFLSRSFFTDYPLSENIVGTLYFIVAGFIFFGWPQWWAVTYDLAFDKKIGERKLIINDIKLASHKINEDLYESDKVLNEEYKKALLDFKALYHSSKETTKNIDLTGVNVEIKALIQQSDISDTQLKKIIDSQPLNEKKIQIEKLSSLLNTRYLPTERDNLGISISYLLTLGIFSNIAFVFLSDMSFFDPTLKKVLMYGLSTGIGLFLFYLLSERTWLESKELALKYGKRSKDFLKDQKKTAGQKLHKASEKVKSKCAVFFGRSN